MLFIFVQQLVMKFAHSKCEKWSELAGNELKLPRTNFHAPDTPPTSAAFWALDLNLRFKWLNKDHDKNSG